MQPRLLPNPIRLAGSSLLRTQSDDRLVALAREGHDPAFAAIVGRYQTELQRYCSRLLGPSRAEDAVQQAFVNAHHAMTADDRPIDLRAWLYRIAHNASLNMMRSTIQTTPLDELTELGGETAEDAALLREQLRDTLDALAALPVAQRDALVMRELEGRSHVEIADALGVSAGAARQQILRARSAMRSALTAITPFPVAIAAASAGAGAGGAAAGGAAIGGGLLAKLGAGLAVTGVVAGGVTAVRPHHTSQPAHRPAAISTPADATPAALRTAPSAPSVPGSGALSVTAGTSVPHTTSTGTTHGGHGSPGASDDGGPHPGKETENVHDGQQPSDGSGSSPGRPSSSDGGHHDNSSGSGDSGASGSGKAGESSGKHSESDDSGSSSGSGGDGESSAKSPGAEDSGSSKSSDTPDSGSGSDSTPGDDGGSPSGDASPDADTSGGGSGSSGSGSSSGGASGSSHGGSHGGSTPDSTPEDPALDG